jgi:hypothetical protein
MSDFDPTQHDPTWQEATDDSRRQRLDALRDIATHTPQVPADATAQSAQAGEAPRPSLAPSPRRSGRRSRPRATWLAAGTLVLAIVVVAVFILTCPGGASTGQQAATATAAPRSGPLVIRPAVDALGCPTAAAWSGDGAQVAVLGTTTCDEQLGQHKLNIYNVSSGKLVAKFRLDETVTSALKVANTSGKIVSYVYTHVLWLGPAVYITIKVTDSAATDYTTALPFVALLRVTPSDPQPVAFVQPNHGANGAVYVRWNPTTGSVQITRDAAFRSLGDIAVDVSSSLPPSLAYDWRADGTPNPLIPVATGKRPTRDPGGPVGVPSSGTRLTIWQPGTVAYVAIQGATPVYIFNTDFAAVTGGAPSILDPVQLRALLVPPGHPVPDKKSLDAVNLATAPWLPVRDAAVQAVMDAMASGAAEVDTSITSIAWRPDGKMLATEPNSFATSEGNPITADITLYDSADGHVISTLQVPPQKGTPEEGLNLLQWSPDGHALMLLDLQLDTLVIWTQEQLPH